MKKKNLKIDPPDFFFSQKIDFEEKKLIHLIYFFTAVNNCQLLWGWGCLLPTRVGHCQLSLFKSFILANYIQILCFPKVKKSIYIICENIFSADGWGVDVWPPKWGEGGRAFLNFEIYKKNVKSSALRLVERGGRPC